MMKTIQSTTSRRAYELTKTLQKYSQADIAHYLIGAMVAVNYGHIKDPENAKILEVLKMAKPFEDLYKEFELIGEKRGRQEEKREIVKNLFKKGIDIKIIAESTGLTVNEVKELIQQ